MKISANFPETPLTSSTVSLGAVEIVPRRSRSLWYDDGTLIIRVHEQGDTAQVTDLRVYRGLIEKASDGSLLRPQDGDLTSLPLDEETGCHVVNLHDDPLEIVTLCLQRLADREGVDPDVLIDVEKFCGALRFSSKYGFAELRNKLSAHLTQCFPSNRKDVKQRLKTFDGFEIAIIKVAWETNIRQVLPFAMYRMASKLSDIEFLEGITLPCGTAVKLSEEDCRICLLARSRILSYMQRTYLDPKLLPFIVYSPIFRIQVPRPIPACSPCLMRLTQVICTRNYGPLHGDIASTPMPRGCLCFNQTMTHIAGLCEENGGDVWNILPSWFGLNSWSELIKN